MSLSNNLHVASVLIFF